MVIRLPSPALPRRRVAALVSGAAASIAVGRASRAAPCLPPDVAPPPSAAAPAEQPSENGARAPAASVFLDVSGSMAGYVARAPARPPAAARPAPGARSAAVARAAPPSRPQPEEPRAFHDVVQSLPQLASSAADSIALFAFGRSMRPLAPGDLGRAGRPEFYADQDSRIQDALARMDALPAGELGILVTDLFLTGDEIFGGAAAIRAPLARILDSGRTVALVGIRTGFSGKIYDIPGQPDYAGATERPFYVIATGPGPIVARLLRRLDTELIAPLPPPADGTPRLHATLFTHTPFPAGPAPLRLAAGAPAEAGARLAADLGADVAAVVFPGGSGTASGAVPVRSMAQGPVLVPDRFAIQEQVWAEPSRGGARAGCAERWVEMHSLPTLARLEAAAGGDPAVTVGGAALARIPPGTTFFLRARVSAVGLSEAPAQTAWTREWNLEAREAEAFVASRPALFRTLNLREVASMLEGLVRDRIRPSVVGEAQLAFQVPRR